MEIVLEQVRLTEYDKRHPDDLASARTLTAESYPVTLDLRKWLRKGTFTKKPASLPLGELVHAIRNVRQTFPDLPEPDVPRMRIKMAVEASKRLAERIQNHPYLDHSYVPELRACERGNEAGVLGAIYTAQTTL